MPLHYALISEVIMNIIYLIMITVSPIFIAISLYNTIEIYRKIKYVDKYGILMAATWFAVEVIGLVCLFPILLN